MALWVCACVKRLLVSGLQTLSFRLLVQHGRISSRQCPEVELTHSALQLLIVVFPPSAPAVTVLDCWTFPPKTKTQKRVLTFQKPLIFQPSSNSAGSFSAFFSSHRAAPDRSSLLTHKQRWDLLHFNGNETQGETSVCGAQMPKTKKQRNKSQVKQK